MSVCLYTTFFCWFFCNVIIFINSIQFFFNECFITAVNRKSLLEVLLLFHFSNVLFISSLNTNRKYHFSLDTYVLWALQNNFDLIYKQWIIAASKGSAIVTLSKCSEPFNKNITIYNTKGPIHNCQYLTLNNGSSQNTQLCRSIFISSGLDLKLKLTRKRYVSIREQRRGKRG